MAEQCCARPVNPPRQSQHARAGKIGFKLCGNFAVVASVPVLLLAGVLVGSSSAAAGTGDADAGQRIAERHCSRCHVIGDGNRFGGIGSTPSFQLLVSALKDWRERFETFYARRPHPAFIGLEGVGRIREDLPPNAHPILLPRAALDDLLAYAERLKLTVRKR